jgi:hypothetical protein
MVTLSNFIYLLYTPWRAKLLSTSLWKVYTFLLLQEAIAMVERGDATYQVKMHQMRSVLKHKIFQFFVSGNNILFCLGTDSKH